MILAPINYKVTVTEVNNSNWRDPRIPKSLYQTVRLVSSCVAPHDSVGHECLRLEGLAESANWKPSVRFVYVSLEEPACVRL